MSVRQAARVANVHSQRLYELRKQDEEFAARWQEAFQDGLGALEDIAIRAAQEGWEEHVYDGDDKLIRRIHKVDPRLALRVREVRQPPGQTLDVTVGGSGVPITVERMESAGPAPTLRDVIRLMIEAGQEHALGLPPAVFEQYRDELQRWARGAHDGVPPVIDVEPLKLLSPSVVNVESESP